MQNRMGRILLAGVTSLCPSGLLWGQPQSTEKQPGLETRERYQGMASVLKNGKPVQVGATMRQITVAGHQQLTLP
jgi:hypothetical protein